MVAGESGGVVASLAAPLDHYVAQNLADWWRKAAGCRGQ
jgi:hypothetical protein